MLKPTFYAWTSILRFFSSASSERNPHALRATFKIIPHRSHEYDNDEPMEIKNITLSEWEIYFANKDKKQLGPNPIFKKGFELFGREPIPRGQAIALDIGCGVGFEAAWILQKGWDRVDCIDALPIVRKYLMKNVPADAEKQGRLTFTPVKIEDFELTTSYRLVCAYFSLFYCDKLEQFDAIMEKALNAVAPDGRFIGAFFGPKHSWNGQKSIIFLTEEELRSYFHDFTIEIFERTESDHDSGIGMAHYDMFHITAKKTRPSGFITEAQYVQP